jgi:hypothetical protein
VRTNYLVWYADNANSIAGGDGYTGYGQGFYYCAGSGGMGTGNYGFSSQVFSGSGYGDEP